MSIRDYMGRGLMILSLTGSMFLGGCIDPQPQQKSQPDQRPQPQRLEQRISQEAARPNGKPDKYAVLISGSTAYRYKKNLSLAYPVLLENGFQREDVYILNGNGNKTRFYPVYDAALKEKIQKLFDNLSKRVDSQDLLFIYTTGHGKRTDITEDIDGEKKKIEVSSLLIRGEDLLETEIQEYLSGIRPKVGVWVSDQCYSGGFAKRIGKGEYIGISASEAKKVSKFSTFPQTFFNSWRDHKSSDRSGDGRVSIREAFDYALQHDKSTKDGLQKPQIFSDMDMDKVFLK